MNNQLRKSTRTVKMPSVCSDFVCGSSQAIATNSHWCNLVAYSSLPSLFQALVTQNSSLTEPSCHVEAVKDPRCATTMNKELQAL